MTDPRPLELTRAKVTDIIKAPVKGRMHPHYVLNRCGHVHVGYYDEITGIHFPTLAKLIEHAKLGGRLHLVVWCEKHRWYEEPAEALVEQLQQLSP